jgi:putative oxidoreductase
MSSLLSPDSLALARTALALRLLLAMFFVVLAVKNLSGDERMADDFRRWGYPDAFRVAVAVAQFAGAAALLVPPLVFPGAAALVVVLLGAAATHLRHDPPLQAVPAIACLVLLLPVLWVARPPQLR